MPSRIWITFSGFSPIIEVFEPHFDLCCMHGIIPKSLLNHPNSFHRGMFKLKSYYDADSLLYSLSHFECNGHILHTLTQWRLLPPLTSTMKLSLFTHAYSSPLSLAARLYRCCTNCSCYINNGWTFSGDVCVCVCVCVIYYKNWLMQLRRPRSPTTCCLEAGEQEQLVV